MSEPSCCGELSFLLRFDTVDCASSRSLALPACCASVAKYVPKNASFTAFSGMKFSFQPLVSCAILGSFHWSQTRHAKDLCK